MDSLVFCIGNRDGGDDAIGPYNADVLGRKKFVDVIDCGTVPENYTAIVKQKKPKQLILIDAVDMGLHPGEVRVVPKEKIGRMHISTHGIPLSVLMDYLEQFVKHVVLIGIQPQSMTGIITDNVRRSGEKLIELISRGKISQIPLLD
jgi:hydrogenase 3 maturation protease